MRDAHREGRASGTGVWGLKAGFKSFRTAIAGDDYLNNSEHHHHHHHHHHPPLQRPSDAKYLIVDIIDEAESADVAHGRKSSNDNDQRDRCVKGRDP